MAKKNSIYYIAVFALSSFVLFPSKKKAKPKCLHLRSREDYLRFERSKAGVKFPVAIVLHPDNVSAQQAEVFCNLTYKEGWTVLIARASEFAVWTGKSIEPGVIVMTSATKVGFKKWGELTG